MHIQAGQLTYCTNIHAGESWTDHFAALQKNIPGIKQRLSPEKPFGIGLRLSNQASLSLSKENNLRAFQQWLQAQQCYVFTMNGFPYGGFHHARVKDQVHAPDWTTTERVQYTLRLFRILAALLPEGGEGGISTSPLSYKYWHVRCEEERSSVLETATFNILQVVEQLIRIRRAQGSLLHLDIEPEPDGLLESGTEFLDWYQHYLLPLGVPLLQDHFGWTTQQAADAIKEHVQLCYDICHFAVGYEPHVRILERLQQLDIRVGKIQISAALKTSLPTSLPERRKIVEAFRVFNEATYLHQVVARLQEGQFKRYPDLPQALEDWNNQAVNEWRSHFHVPLFTKEYGLLQSTQEDIATVLQLQKAKPFTQHLEVETYTWEVLPPSLKMPLQDSIVREMQWVMEALEH